MKGIRDECQAINDSREEMARSWDKPFSSFHLIPFISLSFTMPYPLPTTARYLREAVDIGRSGNERHGEGIGKD